jgi:tripartite-type tricarboxylate transporter receptor subunit TctC
MLPSASAGRSRVIAVSTRERSPAVPHRPGMTEAGLPEYNLEFWYGMFVPVGTPPAIVKEIYKWASCEPHPPFLLRRKRAAARRLRRQLAQ